MSSPLRLTIFSALATAGAALSLASVFHGGAWFFPVMIAILLVSGTSALVRWSPLPSAFEPLLAAVAVTLWVTLLDARSVAHFGFIPGRTAFKHLGRTARNGFTDIRKLPTPVPTHHGLVLLTVIGVSAIALIVDLLAVTLRRAALAGLPLLALFTVCAATGHHGVSIIPFIAAAVGFTALLYADNRERVARWGAALGAGSRARPAPAWSANTSGVPGPGMLGGRVGAAAIGVAVVVPLLIPGLHNGIGRHSNGDGFGSGGGNVSTFNPIVGVGRELSATVNRPVLNYTSTSPTPGYLRLTSLDTYGDGSFTASPLAQPQSANVSNGMNVIASSDARVTTNVRVLNNYAFRWLPAPTTALAAQVDGDWLYDPGTATIFSASNTTAGASYTITSSPDDPTPAQLSSAPTGVGPYAADLAHPQISQQVIDLTKQITANAKSKYDAALDIQNFLTSSRFTYSTSVPADNSTHALTDFLLRTRKGFCQQFATSMAVMARLTGIPSRVAVGFTPGVRLANGTYQVSTHDAHAWPELWFPNYGWLPFEPTPRNDDQTQTPGYAQATPNHHAGSASPETINKNDLKGKNATKPKGFHDGSGSTKKPAASAHHASAVSGLTWLIIGLSLLAAIGLAAPGVARILIRRRRWSALDGSGGGIAAAWAELRDCVVDAGGPWDDGASPRGMARSLVTWIGADAPVGDALGRLAHAEERDRYAPARPDADRALRRDVEEVHEALLRPLPRWFRISGVALPRSVTFRVRRAFGRAADQLQRVETVPGVLGRRARARVRPSS
jgi:hypothetical protein